MREEYKIQQEKDFEKQDRMEDSLLKREDKQLKILELARENYMEYSKYIADHQNS